MSVNKVILVGNLGRDPELRVTQSGMNIANISVATTFTRKDPNTGDRISETEWHRVVFFNRLAEIVSQYLRKGSQVYIEGRLRTNKYTDKDGIERQNTEIVAENMTMLGSRAQQSPDAYGAPAYGAGAAPGVYPQQPYGAPQGGFMPPQPGFPAQGAGFNVPPQAPQSPQPYAAPAPVAQATPPFAPPAPSGFSSPGKPPVAPAPSGNRPAAPKVSTSIGDLDSDIPF